MFLCASFHFSPTVIYWVTQKFPQIFNANHATFPIHIRKITVQLCGNFWVTQYNSGNKSCTNIHPRYKNFNILIFVYFS